MNEMMHAHHFSNTFKLLLVGGYFMLIISREVLLSSFNILSKVSIPSGNDGIEAIESSKELKGVDDWLSNVGSCSYQKR
jgi:hypothetical protein